MKLIVGLGNPARIPRDPPQRRLPGGRGNRQALRAGWVQAPSQVPDAFVAKRFGADPVLLAKPLTFMNLSGDAVAALARYYDVPADDLLIVVDEAALQFGRLSARARGLAGGHNGLKSVIDRLGRRNFPGFGWGLGAGTAGGTWPITCSRYSSARTRRARIVHRPGGRRRRDVRCGGHRQGDEHVQPGGRTFGYRLTPCCSRSHQVREERPRRTRRTRCDAATENTTFTKQRPTKPS